MKVSDIQDTSLTSHSKRKLRRTSVMLFVPVFATLALVFALSVLAQEDGGRLNRVWGERYTPAKQTQPRIRTQSRAHELFNLNHRGTTLRRLVRWNNVAIDASGLDHTQVPAGDPRVFGEQLGPGRSAKAMAIVHIAMFDAINAIEGGFRSFTGIPRVHEDTSVDSAIAQSAHDTLVAMFPSQTAAFDEELAVDLSDIPSSEAKTRGIALGQQAAAAILAKRTNDGSSHAEPVLVQNGGDWVTSNLPGRWRQDPISLIRLALGGHWGEVAPFVLQSASQFRTPAPPSLTSQAYTTAFREVKRLGGDGIVTPTERTADQTHIGIFWGYDGTPSLCAPPRLYNQIALTVADAKNTNKVLDLARLLALVNVSMADAGIAAWESKYHYDFWRPVAGIRETDPGTGPLGQGDSNPNTLGDVTFSPIGAPASNLNGPNFTPPFPAYPSGHATFGGALFETLRNFYRTDHIRFTFVSDEFNGVTVGNDGQVRPFLPRTFKRLSDAEEENGQSRIYLGIHWAFDKTEGIAQGRKVADYVFENAFRRVDHNDKDH